jgi:hypothetical protein
MKKSCKDAPALELYSLRQAAWVLGVGQSAVARAIRLGTLRAVRRRGRLMVPACVIAHLTDRPLGGASL